MLNSVLLSLAFRRTSTRPLADLPSTRRELSTMSAIVPLSSLAQPTSQETESARAQLVAHEAELASLVAQVSLVSSRITALKLVIAPVRRIPTEILSKIIVQAATAPESPAQVLRTLCSICKLWRQITLGTPEAWSKIHVVYRRDPPPSGPRLWLRTLRDVREWLDNSGNSKKDVRMSIGDSTWDNPSAYVDLLHPHMGQVRVLAIHPAFPDDTISPLFTQPLPHLEEYISSGHNPHGSPLIPDWSLAPSLKRLLCVDGQLFSLPRAQRKRLTRLGIVSDDLSTLLNFCSKGGFPALRVLAIDSVNYISEMPNDAVLALPQLEEFHLEFYDPPEMTSLFLHLKLPNLTTLSLCNSLQLSQEEGPDAATLVERSTHLAALLSGLIDNSAPPLKRVFLQFFAIRDEDLFHILRKLPTLERLLLTDVPVTGHFARLLSQKTETGWVCPQLTHISVSSARDWTPFCGMYCPQAWSDASPDALRIRDMEFTIRARAEEAARNPEAVTGLAHVRVYDAESRIVDGKACWVTDKSADELYHDRIFRDTYMPFNRWWRTDGDIIGADLPGL